MEPHHASEWQWSDSPSLAPPPPQQAAAAASASDPARVWLPELVQRFAASLPPNEVACALRLVNKAAAAQFRGPQHATVRLSQPVPQHAFAWRWARPDAMRCLNQQQRQALPCLVARSGSIANLEVLLAREDAPSPLQLDVFGAAAANGQLDVCTWLREWGCPWDPSVLAGAAGGGQRRVFRWLLAIGCPHGDEGRAAAAAASGGHVGLMDWLLGGGRIGSSGARMVAVCAAEGCNLPTLQRLCRTFSVDIPAAGKALLGAAAGSPTADWQEKVGWLEAQGCRRAPHACERAAATADMLPRLQWLRQRGYPVDRSAALCTASAGNVEALQYVLGQGIVLDEVTATSAMHLAARNGSVAVLEFLHARGVSVDRDAVGEAAAGGHLPALAWLVERLEAGSALTARVFARAARSGSLEVMVWLRERGCPWDDNIFRLAAMYGSEEQLDWLAEQGCPMGDDGLSYVEAAVDGDMAKLRCLRRLGCPWGPGGGTLKTVIQRPRSVATKHVVRALGWLLDQGCPVDWAEVESAASRNSAELVGWLRMQRQQRT